MTMTGTLELPVCADCGTVQYPLRERCVKCLSDRLDRKGVAPEGVLLARTAIHHSNEARFRPQLPVEIGSVRLDSGPVLIVMVESGEPGGRVRVKHDAQTALLVAASY